MPSYWDRFPDFDHNPNAPIRKEFRRLAQLNDWIGNDPEKMKTHRKEWGKCFRSEFQKHYGGNASSLAGWQSLCKEVGLEDIPDSVAKCRSALKGNVWVNIVDLVDHRRSGATGTVECHETEEALREYTTSTRRIFPKEVAKKNGFLAALLITL